MEIVVPIKSQLDLVTKWLRFLNPMFSFREDTEIPVLASLVLLAYTHRSYESDTLNSLLFSEDTLNAIREKLGVSERSFNKSLKVIAEKGFILNRKYVDGKLVSGLLSPAIIPADFNLNITFKNDTHTV